MNPITKLRNAIRIAVCNDTFDNRDKKKPQWWEKRWWVRIAYKLLS
jgi:hypothetical protein